MFRHGALSPTPQTIVRILQLFGKLRTVSPTVLDWLLGRCRVRQCRLEELLILLVAEVSQAGDPDCRFTLKCFIVPRLQYNFRAT